MKTSGVPSAHLYAPVTLSFNKIRLTPHCFTNIRRNGQQVKLNHYHLWEKQLLTFNTRFSHQLLVSTYSTKIHFRCSIILFYFFVLVQKWNRSFLMSVQIMRSLYNTINSVILHKTLTSNTKIESKTFTWLPRGFTKLNLRLFKHHFITA